MPLTVRTIDASQQRHFVEQRSASFLQLPSWARVKAEWGSVSVGWFDGEDLIGTGQVLLRRTPRIERYLAYLPEGPVVDWDQYHADDVLAPLTAFLKQRKAFAVKVGPQVVVRRWTAASIKEAIAAGSAGRLGQVSPDESPAAGARLISQLRAAGWRQSADTGSGFGDVQPRYVFQVPLGGRSEEEVLAGFNQLWRRNIKKADKSGVKVRTGNRDDLAEFHRVYVVTSARDGFRPRSLAYMQRMWDAMASESPDRIRLYLAEHEGEVLAATTAVRCGKHVWYSYGASADHKREVRPSNAIQWAMIRGALDVGADTYDMRGISDTLDSDDPLFGLIQFKLGTGGQAVEYVGEWDYPLNSLLYKAFTTYLDRR